MAMRVTRTATHANCAGTMRLHCDAATDAIGDACITVCRRVSMRVDVRARLLVASF